MSTEIEQAAWLKQRQLSGTTQREALEFFDALPTAASFRSSSGKYCAG